MTLALYHWPPDGPQKLLGPVVLHSIVTEKPTLPDSEPGTEHLMMNWTHPYHKEVVGCGWSYEEKDRTTNNSITCDTVIYSCRGQRGYACCGGSPEEGGMVKAFQRICFSWA